MFRMFLWKKKFMYTILCILVAIVRCCLEAAFFDNNQKKEIYQDLIY